MRCLLPSVLALPAGLCVFSRSYMAKEMFSATMLIRFSTQKLIKKYFFILLLQVVTEIIIRYLLRL